MIKIRYLFIAFIIFISCKKNNDCQFQKLADEYIQLTGVWKWQYTVFTYQLASNGQIDFYDTLWPNEIKKEYKILISDESFLVLSINDSLYDEGFFRPSSDGNFVAYPSPPSRFKKLNMNMNPCSESDYSYRMWTANNDTILSENYPFTIGDPHWTTIHYIYTQPSVFTKE